MDGFPTEKRHFGLGLAAEKLTARMPRYAMENCTSAALNRLAVWMTIPGMGASQPGPGWLQKRSQLELMWIDMPQATNMIARTRTDLQNMGIDWNHKNGKKTCQHGSGTWLGNTRLGEIDLFRWMIVKCILQSGWRFESEVGGNPRSRLLRLFSLPRFPVHSCRRLSKSCFHSILLPGGMFSATAFQGHFEEL